MSAPFVVTSRLGNILQMISLARQTGILRMIRGQGATREMGQIRFIDGAPVSALLGQLTGGAALGVLNNWGECYYAFDELAVADVAGPAGPYFGSGPLRAPSFDAVAGANPASSSGVPAQGWGVVPPIPSEYGSVYGSVPSRPSPTSPLSDTSWPVYSYQQSGLFSGSGGGQIGSQGASGPVSPARYPTGPFTSGVSLNQMAGPAVSTMLLTAVPQRTSLAERVEHLPLDRRERMVLLLIDGQRSVGDLARLTRRADGEVQAVLTHLELLGLILLTG